MLVVCIKSHWKAFEVGQEYNTTSMYSSVYKGKTYWYYTFEHTGEGIGFRAENFAIVTRAEETEADKKTTENYLIVAL